MTGVDWLILAVILFSALVAASQGFMHEVFSLAGIVAGYLLAAWGYRQVAPWFAPYVKTPWVADLCGFLTIFFVVVLVAGSIGRIARFGMKEAGLRWFDRVLGGVFGLVRGVLLVMISVLALASFSPGSSPVGAFAHGAVFAGAGASRRLGRSLAGTATVSRRLACHRQHSRGHVPGRGSFRCSGPAGSAGQVITNGLS